MTLAKYKHCVPRCNRLILSRPDILDQLERGTLSFDPIIPPNRVRQVSIDMLLGRRFTTLKKPPGYLPSIQMDPSLWDSEDLWETEEADSFLLKPKQFVLAQTLERVHIPNTLMGLVEGRSSFARVGISVHVTAPKIDPGFKGHITLEMANFGVIPVQLRAGKDMPAQLLFALITTALSESDLYGADPAEDVFQQQTDPIPRNRRQD